jgi:hypothetical protein
MPGAAAAAAPPAPPAPLLALLALLERQRPSWAGAAAAVAAEFAGTRHEGAEHLVYGEVRPEALWALLDELAPRFSGNAASGALFADLGSGCGKAVLAAALHPGVRASLGVELVRCTHATALELAAAAAREGLLPPCSSADEDDDDDECRVDSGAAAAAAAAALPRVRFVRGSLLSREEWVRADIAFANCVTWPEALLDALAERASRMRPGSLLLSVSAPLPSAAFRCLAVRPARFSWGLVNVFVQERQRFGEAWQRRRALSETDHDNDGAATATADWLLDAPQLLALRALAPAGSAGAALLRLPPDAALLLPSVGDSPLARQLATLPGVRHVTAFDGRAADAEAQRAEAEAARIPFAKLAIYAADALDPLFDPPAWRLLQRRGGGMAADADADDGHKPGRAPPWEWLNNGAFDAVIDQSALDALLPLCHGGAAAAGRSLSASCAALKPGGAALLLSLSCPPAVALPLLRGETPQAAAALAGCAAWRRGVTHTTFLAPPGSPAEGRTIHAYLCRKAPAASLAVVGTRCLPASHAPRWDEAACSRCSFAAAGKMMLQQTLYDCLDCGLEAVCVPCARRCHGGHALARRYADSDSEDAARAEACDSEAAEEDEEGGRRNEEEDATRPLFCELTIGYCECGFSGACTATAEEEED